MPPASNPGRESRLVPYLLLIVVALSFGGNWVVGRALNNSVPPFAIAFWRWVLALAILLPFCWKPGWWMPRCVAARRIGWINGTTCLMLSASAMMSGASMPSPA